MRIPRAARGVVGEDAYWHRSPGGPLHLRRLTVTGTQEGRCCAKAIDPAPNCRPFPAMADPPETPVLRRCDKN